MHVIEFYSVYDTFFVHLFLWGMTPILCTLTAAVQNLRVTGGYQRHYYFTQFSRHFVKTFVPIFHFSVSRVVFMNLLFKEQNI